MYPCGDRIYMKLGNEIIPLYHDDGTYH